MPSMYALKPAFQHLLRPLASALAPLYFHIVWFFVESPIRVET